MKTRIDFSKTPSWMKTKKRVDRGSVNDSKPKAAFQSYVNTISHNSHKPLTEKDIKKDNIFDGKVMKHKLLTEKYIVYDKFGEMFLKEDVLSALTGLKEDFMHRPTKSLISGGGELIYYELTDEEIIDKWFPLFSEKTKEIEDDVTGKSPVAASSKFIHHSRKYAVMSPKVADKDRRKINFIDKWFPLAKEARDSTKSGTLTKEKIK